MNEDQKSIEAAAAFGGRGFKPRSEAHAEEVAAGRNWLHCGVCSEVEPLKEVLLSWPNESLSFDRDPNDYLMHARPDLERIREQTEAIAAFYESQGITVHLFRPDTTTPPNLIFMRDLFFMTPEGAVISRMATEQRAGEERFAARALASLGVPIIAATAGSAVFEGADALWLDSKTVLVGVGLRTNREAVSRLASLLSRQQVKVIEIPLPAEVMHLLGTVNFVADDLVVIDAERTPEELLEVLRKREYRIIELQPDEELYNKLGINFVTLAPGRIAMSAGCPGIRRTYEKAGIEVHELDVSEYLKAAGGIGCATGIILREQMG